MDADTVKRTRDQLTTVLPPLSSPNDHRVGSLGTAKGPESWDV